MTSQIEIRADVSESANNLLSEPAKSAGNTVSTIIDFFRNTVLLPMQKYNIKAELNLKQYQKDLESNINQIPKDRQTEPDMNIWGQTMDSLKWNMGDDQEHIRNMFTKILSADIDKNTKNAVQPAFIEIVRQLTKDDARILADIFQKNPSINLYEKRQYVRNVGGPKPRESFLIRRFLATTDKNAQLLEIDFELSLDNLKRLGIINEVSGYFGTKKLADRFNSSGEWQHFSNDQAYETMFEVKQNNRLEVTKFGKEFLSICIG